MQRRGTHVERAKASLPVEVMLAASNSVVIVFHTISQIELCGEH
jgi:hypothetical protein